MTLVQACPDLESAVVAAVVGTDAAAAGTEAVAAVVDEELE